MTEDMEIRGKLKKIDTSKGGVTTITLENALFSGTVLRDEKVLINIHSLDKTRKDREIENVLKKQLRGECGIKCPECGRWMPLKYLNPESIKRGLESPKGAAMVVDGCECGYWPPIEDINQAIEKCNASKRYVE